MCDMNPTDNKTVANFGYLPEESLRALHASLALNMSHDQLLACAAYYRSLGRDATVDELRLIDAYLTSSRVRDRQSMTLSSLSSPDEGTAALLQSLVACCQSPKGTTRPLTLKHCMGATVQSTPELAMADAKTGASLHFVTDEQYGALCVRGLSPLQSVRLGDSGLRLALCKPSKFLNNRTPVKGELIALVRLPDDADEGYFAKLRDVLEHAFHRSNASGVAVCPRGELLSTLITLCPNGCYADTSVLGTDASAARGYLIYANEAGMRALLDSARTCALPLTVFARTTDDAHLTLAERDSILAKLPLSLLHRLEQQSVVSLQLVSHNTATNTTPIALPSRVYMANGWERILGHAAGEPVTLGAHTVMHTTIPLHDALTPRDITRAVMQCALELTAAGGDFDTLCAAMALSVGPDCSPASAWSCVLGVHGVVREWELATHAPIVRSCERGTGELTICLFARTITPQATAAVAQLRLFAVPTVEGGLPDAKTWRAMLSQTSRALAAGQLAGLRPLWNRPLNEALTGVKDLTLDEPWSQRADVLQQNVFGLFVRAEEIVKQGVLLGTLACADQATDEPCDACAIQVPERYSLVHRARPTVVVPLLSTVDVPHTLLAYLHSLGVSIQTLPLVLTHQGCTALADAMAQADIVLLCGDEQTWSAVLDHRRVRHALEQLLSTRDGTLFALRGAASVACLEGLCDDAERLVLSRDGISRAQLKSAVEYYQ